VNNNLNPDFSTFLECDYFFERQQHLRFMVYDVDSTKGAKEFIGKCETTMGLIAGALRQTFVSDLQSEKSTKHTGKIIVRLEGVNACNDEARIKVSANLQGMGNACCSGVNNPYFIISRARDMEHKEEFIRVF
jgi:hypothetical protein